MSQELGYRDWLSSIQSEWLRGELAIEQEYLWPRTAVGNMQAEIYRRIGVSDHNMSDPRCRTTLIGEQIRELITNHLISSHFALLDICCGDGVILGELGLSFEWSSCYGLDIREYQEHERAKRIGRVEFFRCSLQNMVEMRYPEEPFDIVMMLNTFRGWDRAMFQQKDHDIPQRILEWLRWNARFIFLTITKEQHDWLKRSGWFIWKIGPGEDGTDMICGFPCSDPRDTEGIWKWEG